MIQLPDEKRKNGFQYILVGRSTRKAIYAQYLWGTVIGYEVVIIRVHPTKYSHFLNRPIPEREVYPSTGEWGKFAWTYKTLDKPDEKFRLL